jgi:hypothetical protein
MLGYFKYHLYSLSLPGNYHESHIFAKVFFQISQQINKKKVSINENLKYNSAY